MNFLKRGFKAAKSAVGAIFGDETDTDSDYDGDGNGRGWAHKREVVVERPRDPIVQYAVSQYGGEPMGGIQGLWWYAKSLFVDTDGDVANQFIDERDTSAHAGTSNSNNDEETQTRVGSGFGRAVRALVEVAGVRRGDVELKLASQLD